MRENYLRVTEILSPFTGVEFVPAHILDRASERGSAVHKYIEEYLSGFPYPLDQELQLYTDSFHKFWDGYKHNFDGMEIKLEQRFYCDKLEITGMMDFVAIDGKRTYILDWKTSSTVRKSWSLQGAAYKYLLEENGYSDVDDMIFVHLKKGGKKATLHKPGNHEENLNIFLKCLELHKWFEMDKRRKNENF